MAGARYGALKQPLVHVLCVVFVRLPSPAGASDRKGRVFLVSGKTAFGDSECLRKFTLVYSLTHRNYLISNQGRKAKDL